MFHSPKASRLPEQAFLSPISPHNGGAFGELSEETEAKEGERLDAARNTIVTELETWRAKLIEYETDIKSLKKALE